MAELANTALTEQIARMTASTQIDDGGFAKQRKAMIVVSADNTGMWFAHCIIPRALRQLADLMEAEKFGCEAHCSMSIEVDTSFQQYPVLMPDGSTQDFQRSGGVSMVACEMLALEAYEPDLDDVDLTQPNDSPQRWVSAFEGGPRHG